MMVAAREYRATVRTKGFVAGLFVGPLLLGGGAIAMAVFGDHTDLRERRVAVLDFSGIMGEALENAVEMRNGSEIIDPESGEQIEPVFRLELVESDAEGLDRLRSIQAARVRDRELAGFVEIGPGVLHPRTEPTRAWIRYHAENPAGDPIQSWLARTINDELRRLRLREAGVDLLSIQDLFDWIPAEGFALGAADEESGGFQQGERITELEAVLIPLAMQLMMLVMLLMGAMPLLAAVTEEKAQRIAEVMLGSVSPFEFMLGKVLGGVAVSLTASLVYLAAGAWAVWKWEIASLIPFHVIPWFFAFMILATLMLGALVAALGSACSDAGEAQSLQFPATLPIMIPILLAVPVAQNPAAGFATGLSLFPLFTPLLMILRQSTPGGVPPWQAWTGLGGVAVFTILLVWLGGRVFRVGILMQGTPPRLKNLLRWAVRG